MLVFTSPSPVLAAGRLDYAIARKDGNQYFLIFARRYGMAYTREVAYLNSTTHPSEVLAFSKEGRPCIWFDTELERDSRDLAPKGTVLPALLDAVPRAPIQRTGRMKAITAVEGGERETFEVEILLSEDDLAHCCYYCGDAESASDGNLRFERIGGEGYSSTYWCSNVCGLLGEISTVVDLFQ
ncbi:hypothetical protein EW146_g3132 [Bondarzewia mesenterica]|uniref:Uncharacterized protein n=1 Tax=Bondarzewia mesenterica TaxID=1095465 RepID=A0A4S4M0C6_9AGAM|nr:hypothetical protein EW146_g3132 [Bondarzewia mesenterica]